MSFSRIATIPWLLVLLIAFAPSCKPSGTGSTTEKEPGTLKGVVRDASSNEPVAGAMVAAANQSQLTGDDGAYEIEAPPGDHSVEVTKEGYLPYKSSSAVAVESGKTVTHDVLLKSIEVKLPRVRLEGPPANLIKERDVRFADVDVSKGGQS